MIRRVASLLLLTLALSAANVQPVDEAGYARLVSAKKGKVVLVNFWATWCSPCREEMPALSALQKKLASRGFELITVSADELEDAPKAEAFLVKTGVRAPHYLKRAKSDDAFINAIDAKWSGALPASFLYDRQGKKVKAFFGEVEMKDLEAAIKALL